MIERPREEDEKEEKVEIDPNDIEEDFSELDIEVRKVLWIILKSITDEAHRSTVTSWLNSDYGQKYKDYYQTLQTKIGSFFVGECSEKVKEMLKPIDTVVQMSDAQVRHLFMIETRIYEFFGKNPDLYNAIVHEVNADLGLGKFGEEFKQFLIAAELENLVTVEIYFINLDVDIKETLWLALNSPFDLDSRSLAYNWLNDGLGRVYYNDVKAFDEKLKTFLEGKLDQYLEVLNYLEDKSRDDPEEKIYKFFAANLALFEFIQTELSKDDSVMMKILRDYKRFLEVPVYTKENTLRAVYDKTHPRKSSAGEKDAPSLRQLGLFANLPSYKPGINVCSISLENCFFHTDYYKSYRANKTTAIIDCNTEFFDHFAATPRDQFKEIIFMNGSLRQSYPADEFCLVVKHPLEPGMLISESCFTALPSIANYATSRIDKVCMLDDYLLVDTFCNLEEGQTFRAGVKKLADDKFEAKELEGICVNDKSKVILLYAQMHHSAVRFKNNVIQFDFYSGDFQELQNIYIFFINHRVMKPHNVFLNLFLYTTKPLTTAKTVEQKFHVDNYQGCSIDFDYKINLKIMLQACNLPDKDVRPLSPTDDKRMNAAAKPMQPSSRIHALMPATITVEVNEKFNAPVFSQMRMYKESLKEAEFAPKTTPMALSGLR
jgi:hypothetical protein